MATTRSKKPLTDTDPCTPVAEAKDPCTATLKEPPEVQNSSVTLLEDTSLNGKLDFIIDKVNKLDSVPKSLKNLKDEIDELNQNVKTIPDLQQGLASLADNVKSYQEEAASNRSRIDSLEETVEKLETEKNSLRHELDTLKVAHLKLEREQLQNKDQAGNKELSNKDLRKNNLVIEGVPEQLKEDVRQIVHQIIHDTGVHIHDLELDETFRVGRKPENGLQHRARPIVVTFTRTSTRNKIYRARLNIKRNKACASIWINEDVDECTRIRRANLKALVDLALREGHSARQVYDTIIVDGRKYTFDTLHKLPPDLTLERAYQRHTAKGIHFFSENVHMSNFAPTPFVLNGIKYETAEQALMYQKAIVCGDREAAEVVLRTKSQRRVKRLGMSIKSVQRWENEKEQHMKDILRAKYEQNDDIKQKLLATGDRPLIEATNNPFWGAGAHLTSKEITEGTWRGKNTLGLLLQDLRRTLRS